MTDLGDLSAAELLAAEESGVLQKRQQEVDSLLRLLAWCDLHSVDPQSQPGAVPARFGGDRLVRLGGEGTPETSELCLTEFAVASRVGYVATSHRAAAALDLRHRLPHLWERVQQLDVEVWVARRIAELSRKLSRAAVELVDVSVAAAHDLPPGKLIELAEARIIEADPEAHRKRIAAEEARIGVFARRRRTGDAVASIDGQAGVQPITLRLPDAGALEFTTSVEEVAQALADQHVPADEDDVPTMHQFRARAVELLADPYAAVRFLEGLREPEATPAPQPARTPRRATVYVHLDAAVLAGFATGIARVEDLGPMLLEQVAALLRHRSIDLHPVIDLSSGAAVDAYEHPATCKERTRLRTGGDVFPHSASRTRRLDHDHVAPYDKDGPPGQTGDHNDAPLTRRHHRAKTHLPYRTRQLALGAYRWETPHGLLRVVSRYGTTVVEPLRSVDGTLVGEAYPARYDVCYDAGPPAHG
ncbi:hypothetical protein [Nocardioides daeguensis]|uniref:DUF222 domain-containing protein n=1 Tax=Nocardioides daeguensis TaxID=908359 RepID=A0ABP6UQJ9_9ACTN|nr:hypothetical protein [Nocardioides daeguensis]MBV6728306.1 hypothetical protein [Nocardioides daeguensis]MCR1773115.1 hypothetical protein [Nocardioides daeguensis]